MNVAHAGLSGWGLGFLAIKPGDALLDIGCGGGANLRRMLDAASGVKVRGLDSSPESVALSRRVAPGSGGLLEVKLGEAGAIPWPDGEFDIVTAFETVYFWSDLPACFREVARVLKPGGLFQITNSLNPGLDPSSGQIWMDTLDIGEIARTDLGAVMAETGFSDIQKISGVKRGLVVRGRKISPA
jgi:ubiquinone/menaquinone biosynthesis C-methylase UbiE